MRPGGSGNRLQGLWLTGQDNPYSCAHDRNNFKNTQKCAIFIARAWPRASCRGIAAEMGLEVDKVHHIRKFAQKAVSLETPVGEDKDKQDSVLAEFIKDDQTSPKYRSFKKSIKDRLKEISESLLQEN
jgi:DNA-directed RNA polymerase sigma subunit (sigma70/sigma32)